MMAYWERLEDNQADQAIRAVATAPQKDTHGQSFLVNSQKVKFSELRDHHQSILRQNFPRYYTVQVQYDHDHDDRGPTL